MLFGIPIDDLTMTEAIERIGELVAVGRARGTTFQVATVNVDFLTNASADAELTRILRASDLNTADGMPVVWGARRLGATLRERVTGADLVPAMAAAAATHGWHVHLYGSAPGVAEEAAASLMADHPGSRFTADSGGKVTASGEADEADLQRIVELRPDVLCVALGNPKQERFIDRHRERLGVPVSIGVGGTLDMIVGGKRRAPGWVQRSGLEWVFRAAQEPMRLGPRYAHDARVFLPRLARELRGRKRHGAGRGLHPVQVDGGIRLAAGDDHQASAWSVASSALRSGSTVFVDDDPERGPEAERTVVGLTRLARRSEGTLRFVPVDQEDR
jgi:N-acetylglucosaminyldiphosphoundecaprenol N-acetyl-beta-D-mannosaminyltransferase